jgi:serine/threonine protein kinase
MLILFVRDKSLKLIPANLLFHSPKTNTLRLIDFGSACDMSGWTSKAGYRGQNKGPRSILYCAPEEFIDEENPYAFDVYGVAVTWLRTILSEDEILNNETDTRQSSFGLGNEENLFKWRLAVRDFSHCLVSWEEYAVLHNEVPFGWDCLFGSSREGIHALRLLSSMMNYSPGNRISASEALLGPYLNADCNAELPPELPPAMPWSLSSHVQRWKKEREVQHEECRLEDLFTDVVAVELEFPLRIIFETQKGGGVKVAGIESKAELTQKMVREGDTLLAIGSLDVEGASLEHIKELLDQWGADKITVPLLLVRASGYSG